ncbi:MAG: lysylphosphatidylglycerol synthase transmembrane domain-containing protein [bacterium]
MTSDNSHISSFKRYAGVIIPFFFMGLFLYFAFRNVDLNEALSQIVKSSIPWLLLFLFTFLFSHFLRAVRWKVIISSVKKDASVLNLWGATMVGYGVNCVVPRLGELYRALFLGRWEGLSRTSMLGTIIIERIIDVIALGLSVLVGIYFYGDVLFFEIPWLSSALLLGFTMMFAIIVFLYLLVRFKGKFYNFVTKIFGMFTKRGADKLSYIFDMLLEGFSTLKDFKSFFITIILTVAIMLNYGVTSYFAFFMLRMNDAMSVSFLMAWVLMTISAFGVVIPTPGGTGSYHLIVISVLTGLYGFSNEVSAAYAILTHIISYIVFILLTVFFIFVINKKHGMNENFFSVFRIKPGE